MTQTHETNRAAPMVELVNDAIRENPLAAGLIGAGLAWMLLGSTGFGRVAGVAKNAAGKAVSAAVDAGEGMAGGIQGAASKLGASARELASTVGHQAASIVPDIEAPSFDKPADAFKEAGNAVRSGVESAVTSGRQYGQVLQSRLSDSLERQPLLLGAIGLAIGAGVASAFATTELESQWFGEQGDAARNALKGVVDEAKDRALEVVSEVQEEASRQGLSLDAAKEAASAVAGKVKNVAGSAGEAVKKPVASTI